MEDVKRSREWKDGENRLAVHEHENGEFTFESEADGQFVSHRINRREARAFAAFISRRR